MRCALLHACTQRLCKAKRNKRCFVVALQAYCVVQCICVLHFVRFVCCYAAIILLSETKRKLYFNCYNLESLVAVLYFLPHRFEVSLCLVEHTRFCQEFGASQLTIARQCLRAEVAEQPVCKCLLLRGGELFGILGVGGSSGEPLCKLVLLLDKLFKRHTNSCLCCDVCIIAP